MTMKRSIIKFRSFGAEFKWIIICSVTIYGRILRIGLLVVERKLSLRSKNCCVVIISFQAACPLIHLADTANFIG